MSSDVRPCPKCPGYMYPIQGVVAIGIVPNYRKRDYVCGRCFYSEVIKI